MKHSVIFAALGLAACGVAAQETGTVISSTPVVQQVPVCAQGYVARPGPTTGGGAVIGAITGAAIGSTIGGGAGQAAAIGIGAIAGGAVGNSIESHNNARMVPTCASPVSYESRTVGYNVTYEYNGRRYQAQLPTDPGPTIRVRTTPNGDVRPMMRMYRGAAMAGGPVTAPPVQYAQRQRPMQMQQPMPHQQMQPQQHQQMQMQPGQHQQMQMQQPQHPIIQQQPAPDIARNYGEAVPPEQERQGTNWSATESGNAAMFYGHPHGYGYGYPAYPATYGYPAYPAYGYGYPAAVGVAVLPAYRPFYRPWVGYRPWGYRAWGYGPRVSFGFGWRGGWR